jgi:hypothetical protein
MSPADDVGSKAPATVAKPILTARPVAKRDTDYKARVADLKKTYPKILARLAE